MACRRLKPIDVVRRQTLLFVYPALLVTEWNVVRYRAALLPSIKILTRDLGWKDALRSTGQGEFDVWGGVHSFNKGVHRMFESQRDGISLKMVDEKMYAWFQNEKLRWYGMRTHERT